MFGAEKLEWHGYDTVEKFWRYVYSFWQSPRSDDREMDRQTDGRTPHNSI